MTCHENESTKRGVSSKTMVGLPKSGREYAGLKSKRHLSNIFVLSLCIVSFMAGSLWTTMLTALLPSQQLEGSVYRHILEEQLNETVSHDRPMPEERHLIQKEEASTNETANSASAKAIVTGSVDRDRISDSSYAGLPASVGKYAVGMARVDRDNFTQTFDMGVPIDKTDTGMEDVWIIYKGTGALPNIERKKAKGVALPKLSSEEATANCESMHVILTEPSSQSKQCIAIVPQYPSFYIQNWMRVESENGGPVRRENPLRFVSRGEHDLPPKYATKRHWDMLQTYFSSIDDVLKELDALTKSIAQNRAIVVMVCNHGQSELLMNFACSAKARGISIKHVLVFATDPETEKLANELGMSAYYDERNFGHTPSKAAETYGDTTFAAMMLAKIYCVQMVNMLGYDVLFQDVDIVWYRDPLPFFQNASSPVKNFDIYFQEDGNHQNRYAPYSANSGFYYVRYSDRSRHFLTSFLMAGDLVLNTRSHQEVMISILAEHASKYGLRVKVFQRQTTDEFPGGWHYHLAHDWMKAFLLGEKHPYIFHMSWTHNKDNKLLFLRQMGEWYVQDKCIGQTADGIVGKSREVECCSAEPLISCHYRDKPSKLPCSDSPFIDKNGRPFW